MAWTERNRGVASEELEACVSPTEARAAYARFSTSRLRDAEAGLRAFNERHLVLRLHPLEGTRFYADVVVHKLAGLGILAGVLSRFTLATPPFRERTDDVFMPLSLRGTTIVLGRGREMTLGDGDGAVLIDDTPHGFSVTNPGRVRFLGLRLSRGMLSSLGVHVDDVVMRPIPATTGAFKLLMAYLHNANDPRMLDGAGLASLFVRHVHDLVALAVDTTQRVASGAASRSLRAARLRSIQADVVKHLRDPGLNEADVAQRQAISTRYVRKLFEGAGTSFSEFVLELRLARAYRLLSDPEFGARTVGSIAFDTGFGDLSYFHRAFRHRYGMTPSEIRRV
jgi:AraC-like DNA-binding protein